MTSFTGYLPVLFHDGAQFKIQRLGLEFHVGSPEFGILCTRPSAFPEVASETSDVSQCWRRTFRGGGGGRGGGKGKEEEEEEEKRENERSTLTR